MVGKNLLEMRDTDGVFLINEMIAIGNSPEGRGWFRYKWPNPILNNKVEAKESYVERFGDVYISCGIYP